MKTLMNGALAALACASMTVASARAKGAEPSVSVDQSAMAFAALDTDHSGELSRTELEAGQIRAATERFRGADQDQNETLTAEEYAPVRAQALERRAQLPWFVRRRVPQPPPFESLDADGDRAIALVEWLDAGKARRAKMFDRADRDDSQTISREELEALKARMRRFMGSASDG